MTGYWQNLDRHDGGAYIDEIWLNHPLVRAEVNRRVSGDVSRWATHWLRDQVKGQIGNALSIGCGTGAFERDVVHQNIVGNIIGIDNAAAPLERARELAGSPRISYVEGDAIEFLRGRTFDAVFFHASLHHFADPDGMLVAVRASLREGGYFYFDEYVGPSRDEWSWMRLIPANVAYYLLPRSVRRPRLVRAPINREDPTEAIASSMIMPALRKHFPGATERMYGGNLLSVVYPNLHRPPSAPPAQFDRAVQRLIALENLLLRLGARSYYCVALARR